MKDPNEEMKAVLEDLGDEMLLKCFNGNGHLIRGIDFWSLLKIKVDALLKHEEERLNALKLEVLKFTEERKPKEKSGVLGTFQYWEGPSWVAIQTKNLMSVYEGYGATSLESVERAKIDPIMTWNVNNYNFTKAVKLFGGEYDKDLILSYLQENGRGKWQARRTVEEWMEVLKQYNDHCKQTLLADLID